MLQVSSKLFQLASLKFLRNSRRDNAEKRRARPRFVHRGSSRLVDTPNETVVESVGNIVTRILRSHILFPTRREMKFAEQSATSRLWGFPTCLWVSPIFHCEEKRPPNGTGDPGRPRRIYFKAKRFKVQLRDYECNYLFAFISPEVIRTGLIYSVNNCDIWIRLTRWIPWGCRWRSTQI